MKEYCMTAYDPTRTPPADPAPARSSTPAPAPPRDPMQPYGKVFAWVAIALVAGGLLWLLSSMLLPFVIALILSYFLDPVVRALTRRGLSRVVAALMVALLTFGTLLAVVGGMVPLVLAQGSELMGMLPDSWAQAEDQLEDTIPDVVEDRFAGVGDLVSRALGTLRDTLPNLAEQMAGSVSGLISVLMFWVVMPVVTVYLLMDWPRLIAAVDSLLPRPQAPTLRGLARDMDAALAGYIRGQVMVCSILIGYYSVALSLVGLPFAIVVGVVTGAVSFIPYVGMFIGTSLGVGIAAWQFWGDPGWIAAVVAIYALGLFAESEVLVPRLVGDAVNLHPVWLIFAVIAFGTLLGFVGALIAVPLAAATGVVVRFGVHRYWQSTLYRGGAR